MIRGSYARWHASLPPWMPMARAVADFAPAPTIGELSVASALGYLDLRFEEIAWRRGQAALAAWFDSFAARPSMQSTAPTLCPTSHQQEMDHEPG
ncbi:hypothetical protein [Roseovarius confluentis]|uniref:hypothetical protein n=1 Tax=Roseovarius confluentis TaxID=1852027 RepID=UPI003BA99DB4